MDRLNEEATMDEDRPETGRGAGVVFTVAERVRLIAVTILAVVALLGMVAGAWAALNRGAKEANLADIQQLRDSDVAIIKRQDATDARIDRLVGIIEIQATIFTEPKGSPEYARAVAQLRAMRRVVQ